MFFTCTISFGTAIPSVDQRQTSIAFLVARIKGAFYLSIWSVSPIRYCWLGPRNLIVRLSKLDDVAQGMLFSSILIWTMSLVELLHLLVEDPLVPIKGTYLVPIKGTYTRSPPSVNYENVVSSMTLTKNYLYLRCCHN